MPRSKQILTVAKLAELLKIPPEMIYQIFRGDQLRTSEVDGELELRREYIDECPKPPRTSRRRVKTSKKQRK